MTYQPWVQNPQWEESDPRLKQLAENRVRLPHLDQVLREIPLGEGIFSILGPRQVGKSTLLRLIAKKGLKQLPPKAVLLIEGDEIESWRELRSVLIEAIDPFPRTKFRGCILIDEITGITDWHRCIKTLADQGLFSGILVLYTGSSVTSLATAGELFPGRRGRHSKTNFELLPVSYRDLSKHLTLEEYFVTGGFPWAINEYLRLGVLPEYVGEIYWSWIRGEFLKHGKSDVILRHLVKALARRVVTGFSYNTMAREMGIASNDTARQYLELLNDCFATYEVLWMDPYKQALAPRKNRKFYPIDPLLFHLFHRGGTLLGLHPKQQLPPELAGQIAEGVVCQELRRIHQTVGYWSGKREIDFVPFFVEVKYQTRVIPQEFLWFEKISPKRNKLIVLTKNDRFHVGSVKGIPLKEWLEMDVTALRKSVGME